MVGLLQRLRQALGGGAAGARRRVALALAERMGAQPRQAGATWRIRGSWKGARCQVTVDAAGNCMTAELHPPAACGQFRIGYATASDAGTADQTFVSERVALSEADAATLERLPLSLRLHLIEVVEAGRGEVRLEGGAVTLRVARAGLDRPDAAAQAAIRLDVLTELAGALPGALAGTQV